MRRALSAWPKRPIWLAIVAVAITVFGAVPTPGESQSGPRREQLARPPALPPGGPGARIEGRVSELPSDNIVVTDIAISRLRSAQISEGEVLNVELAASLVRARFVGASELDYFMKDRDAWAAADVDVLCFETANKTLAITGAGGALADLVRARGDRGVVVSKP